MPIRRKETKPPPPEPPPTNNGDDEQSVAQSNFMTHATLTGSSAHPHSHPDPEPRVLGRPSQPPPTPEGQGQDNPVFVLDEPLTPPPSLGPTELEHEPETRSEWHQKSQKYRSASETAIVPPVKKDKLGKSILASAFKISTISSASEGEMAGRDSNLSSIFTRASILPRITRFQSYAKPSIVPEHKTPKGKCTGCLHQYLGIILTVLTSLVMSLGSFFVKILQKKGNYSPFYTTFWRFLGVFVPAVPTLIYFQYFTKAGVLNSICPVNKNGNWKNILFIMIRGIVGTSGFIFQYFALNYITLADTSVISFSSPVFVILFGRLCLKEECGFFNTFIAICTVMGVLIIAKPPFIFGGEDLTPETLIGIGLASASCLSNTLVYICLRFLKDVHFSVISIMFGSIGLVISIGAALYKDSFVWPDGLEHWFLFFGVAGLGFLGQVGLTFALKYEQAGIVSAFRTSDVLFSFIWQAIDGLVPNLFSVIGAVIVITCVSLLAFRKWLKDQEPDSKIRRRLWWVLK